MLEIASFEITSAEIALQSSADRIELCTNGKVGGLTPNIDEFRYLKEKYTKPIHVMIRPSGGSFFYSDLEFLQMQKDLKEFRNAGADAFVFGILTENEKVDLERNKILIDLAEGKPCVFHRAIDRTPNIFEATEQLIALGFSETLTSGGKNSAVEGKDTLKKLVADYSHQLHILISGGVRSGNITELKNHTLGTRFHSSAILPYESFANADEIKKLKEFSS